MTLIPAAIYNEVVSILPKFKSTSSNRSTKWSSRIGNVVNVVRIPSIISISMTRNRIRICIGIITICYTPTLLLTRISIESTCMIFSCSSVTFTFFRTHTKNAIKAS